MNKHLDQHLDKLPPGVPHPFEFMKIKNGLELRQWRQQVGVHPRFLCKILRINYNSWKAWETGQRRLPDWVFAALWYVAVTQNYFFKTDAERVAEVADEIAEELEEEDHGFPSPILGV